MSDFLKEMLTIVHLKTHLMSLIFRIINHDVQLEAQIIAGNRTVLLSQHFYSILLKKNVLAVEH